MELQDGSHDCYPIISTILNDATRSTSRTQAGSPMVEAHGPTMDQQESPSGGIPGPPERLLRLPEVMERVGLRRTAIYQRMREGRFPASRSLGPRCTVWVESEVDEWVKSVISSKITY